LHANKWVNLPLLLMIKVLITGPESSGKSVLAEQLAKHYNSVMVEEYARTYLEGKTGYQESDLSQIALGQVRAEEEGRQKSSRFLFCDTGLEVIKIWSIEKYKRVDPIILEMLDQAKYDLIFLCKPNIPWQPDPLRENPIDRDRLFSLYVDHFESANLKVHIIDASIDLRVKQAIAYLDSSYN